MAKQNKEQRYKTYFNKDKEKKNPVAGFCVPNPFPGYKGFE
jgi:hypothetical protein